MKKILLLIIVFILNQDIISAQTVEINGVRKNEFRSVKGIKDRGYYTFYVNEKIGNGMTNPIIFFNPVSQDQT